MGGVFDAAETRVEVQFDERAEEKKVRKVPGGQEHFLDGPVLKKGIPKKERE